MAIALAAGLSTACSDGGDDPPSSTTTSAPPATTAPPTTEPPGERLFVFSLGPGECFDQRVVVEEDQEVPADFRVDCSLPHQNEVFVAVDHPAPAGDPFPDDDTFARFLTEQCYSQVEIFLGTPYELSQLEVGVRKPTPDAWANEPDRQVVCWLYDPSGAKLTGSVQGSKR